jgi:hypothetical protein
MRLITRHLVPITVILIFVSASSHAAKPPPIHPGADVPAYSGQAGTLVVNVLREIKVDAEHYAAQVTDYDRATLAMRIVALLASVTAAILLAAANAEWSRRTALVLTIVAASVPAADQIFQVSENDRASWKAAVDSQRLFEDCKESWESTSRDADENDLRMEVANRLVSSCRHNLARIVDTEMEVSLKALQLPAKIEAKSSGG